MNTMTSINTYFALNTSKQLVTMSGYLSIHKSAKAVLAAIVAHFDVSNQYAYIKQETIAIKAGLSLRQAKRWLKRLAELKLIDIHHTLVFNEDCGRKVYGVNQYVPNIEIWKKMLAKEKVLSSYKRVTKNNKVNESPKKEMALGNGTTFQLDLSNKKISKSNNIELTSYPSLNTFFNKKSSSKTWLDYKTGLIFASYKDFMQKSNVIGFISHFKRAKLAAEMIEKEKISIEKINTETIAEYEDYKNKKANNKINTIWSYNKSEQFSYEYVDKNNQTFYFESKASFKALKKAYLK